VTTFKHESGDWTRYRELPNLIEIDFHRAQEHPAAQTGTAPYHERMASVGSDTFQALQAAQVAGKDWVPFTHGSSTSRRGATTSRSIVRGLMRSREAAPFIVRSQCIQHDSVFLARIRRQGQTRG